jgi:2-polyprenyl-6-methoxyphenol hydroxylase-like FAD-dependent oxidoreductase
MDTDVLIVGAGPTGLMLANELARRGVRALIIDRHSGPAQQSRAMAVHARTLEIYQKLGIAERAIELGLAGPAANMWADGRWTARVPIGEIGRGVSPFPYVLMLGQDDNERILGRRLEEQGSAVVWNTELVALEQHDDRVEATLRLPDGSSRRVTAAYVAGCDGVRSAVRTLSEIDFPGAPYEHVFFVADTIATGGMKPSEINVYLWRDGFHLFFPMRAQDGWRVIGILPEALRGKPNLTFDDVIPALRREAGAELKFHACHWFSTYRIHHRCAESFRVGRCLLLGDAAHVHSPMGGQGMNTGLQDAYNLAWKLALVVGSRADAALLDTYASERRAVAEKLLHSTDRAFQVVTSDTWFGALLRTKILARVAAFAMTKEPARKLAFRTLSQTGICYPRSALSQTLSGLPAKALAAGERFPWLSLQFTHDGSAEDLYTKLEDTTFNLLVFGQRGPTRAPACLNDIVRTHVIPATDWNRTVLVRAGIPGTSFYLLRPDGHVGLAGARLDEETLRGYFAERCRLRSPITEPNGPVTTVAATTRMSLNAGR